jgi:hypothetical protein
MALNPPVAYLQGNQQEKIIDILISMGVTTQDHIMMLDAKTFKKHFGTSPVIAAGLLAIASYLCFAQVERNLCTSSCATTGKEATFYLKTKVTF